MFERYIGVDYSGAQTPTSSLKGLRVYQASRGLPTTEVPPPPSPRKYWTRKEVAEWLVSSLQEGNPQFFVGIDHAFSFPLKYFTRYGLPRDWSAFLDDFQMHWPTNGDHMFVDFVRHDLRGAGALRSGNSRWRRITEIRAKTAKSVFHFDCQGTVAKSTHAGLPWLRYIRQQLGPKAFFWPFDGWCPPQGVSVIAEVYPALWSKHFDRVDRTGDQHDAFVIAEWARRKDERGLLKPFFTPRLPEEDMAAGEIEGWIFGLE